MTARPSTITGADGVSRCAWVGSDPVYERYHDEEWGRPLHGDRPLFEKIALEGFQAGLSWITILRRREALRQAFHGFEIDRVATMESPEVETLMLDERIIRNRAKIEATIANARLTLGLPNGELDRMVWEFAPAPGRPRPRSLVEIPAVTNESAALSAALRALGYRFVGATTIYALMQSAGLVDDHVTGCHRGG